MPARKPLKAIVEANGPEAVAELEKLGAAADRGPGPDDAVTHASHWIEVKP